MAASNTTLTEWPEWVKTTDRAGAPKKYEDEFFAKWFDGKFHILDSTKDFPHSTGKNVGTKEEPKYNGYERSSAMALLRGAAKKANLKIEVRPHPKDKNVFAIHARPYTEDEQKAIEQKANAAKN